MKTKIYRPNDFDSKNTILESVYGNYLKGAGIELPYGGWAVVNRNCNIREGDLVHCTRFPGSLPYIIRVKKIIDGVITVETCYGQLDLDISFEAAEIFGVVTYIFCKQFRTELYKRPKAYVN